MNIKTSALRHFQKLASNFKDNGILPITGYIRFKEGKITKTAISSFIQMDCDGVDEELLVEEKHLYNLLNSTASEFINISIAGKKVSISDTRDKLVLQTADAKTFPSIPEPESEIITLSESFSVALQKASSFALPKEMIPTFKSFVMVGGKTVCASDGFIAFKQTVEEELSAVIEKSIAGFVSKLPINGFASGKNYFFFFADGLKIGYSTHEIGYVDMNRFFPPDKAKPNFILDSGDLLSFNSLAAKTSTKRCVMSGGKISLDDPDLDVSLHREVAGATPMEPFEYYPEQMNRVLAAVQTDEIDFINGDRMYYMKSSDENQKFTALIMKLAN